MVTSHTVRVCAHTHAIRCRRGSVLLGTGTSLDPAESMLHPRQLVTIGLSNTGQRIRRLRPRCCNGPPSQQACPATSSFSLQKRSSPTVLHVIDKHSKITTHAFWILVSRLGHMTLQIVYLFVDKRHSVMNVPTDAEYALLRYSAVR
jgi:hypothetical protein